jgi:hypothetical protein
MFVSDQFFNFGCFTNAIAEVVQFCAPNAAFAGRFYFNYTWARHWEDTLNAFTTNNATNGERAVAAAVTAFHADDGASENLNALFVAFFDSSVNVNGIAYTKLTEISMAAFCILFDEIDEVHSILQSPFFGWAQNYIAVIPLSITYLRSPSRLPKEHRTL